MSASPNIFEVDSSTCHVPDYVCMMLAVKVVPRTCYVGPVVVRDGGGEEHLAVWRGSLVTLNRWPMSSFKRFSNLAEEPKHQKQKEPTFGNGQVDQ